VKLFVTRRPILVPDDLELPFPSGKGRSILWLRRALLQLHERRRTGSDPRVQLALVDIGDQSVHRSRIAIASFKPGSGYRLTGHS